MIQHVLPLPDGMKKPFDDCKSEKSGSSSNPFIAFHETADDQHDKKVYEKKTKHWMKANGVISEAGGHQAHIIALAYVSDCFFLGTVTDIHNYKKHPGKMPSQVGMQVSLDHTIYFYEPRKFRADEWMLFHMSSPWAGQGRGLVMQNVFAADGTLIATCYQEGVLRLKQTNNQKDSKL